jgi:8-oxo-dGTP diphosphatase
VALILDRGRCFVQRRDPAAASCPGLWEFPGGKLEPGESPRAALLRELREELRWRPDQALARPALSHAYPGFSVLLHPFLCAGTGPPRTDLAWGWFTREQLARLPMPEASRPLLGWIP